MKKTTGWSVDENPAFSGLFCINQTKDGLSGKCKREGLNQERGRRSASMTHSSRFSWKPLRLHSHCYFALPVDRLVHLLF